MVRQKQRIAIADRRAPVPATPPSVFVYVEIRHHRSYQILLVGHHQGECRLMTPGLHRIKSVGSCRKMLPNKRRTSTLLSSFLPSPKTILCHKRAFRT